MPANPSGAEAAVLRKTDEVCALFYATVLDAVNRIKLAEESAVARLEAYVPTEPLLNLKEAAAYLGFTPRTLDSWTKPGREPLLPFIMLGTEKRFRKAALDRALESKTVQPRVVRL